MMRRFLALLMTALLVVAVGGCSGGDEGSADAQTVGFQDATEEDFYSALYQVVTMLPTETAIEGVDFIADTEASEVRATFETSDDGDDLRAIADDAEAVCRLYSSALAQVLQARYQDQGDTEAAESLDALVAAERANAGDADAPGQASSAGGLYDTYKLVVVVQSEDGSVSIDGERDAGADSEWRWQ